MAIAMAARKSYSRPPKPTLSEDAYKAKIIRDVMRAGTWRTYLPLPLDGEVTVDSRSEEYGVHAVYIQGRFIRRCSGICQAHVTCWHRVQIALAKRQEEYPDWKLEALCDPTTGDPHPALVWTLIEKYLTAPPRPPFRLPYAEGPEVPYAGREPVTL